MLKRQVCEGGGMNGILKIFFSPHLSSELWIYSDRTLIRFFSGGGKMRLIKRGRIDRFFSVQLFAWPLYLCFPPASFKLLGFFYFYWYVLGFRLSFAILAQNICVLTCVLFYVQQHKYLMTITTESILIPWFFGNIKLVFLLFQQICLSKRTANNK